MRQRLVSGGLYVTAALASVLICFALYDFWGVDFHFPIASFVGDYAMFTATLFKGMADNAWYSTNAFVGAPTGLDLRDYPMPDLFVHVIVKLATIFTHNPFVIQGWMLVASFPLVTLTALYVLRRFEIRGSIALAFALLFSFLPFHHMRGLGHVYYMMGLFTVPLATLVAVRMALGRGFSLRTLRSRESVEDVLIAALVGLTGTGYFTFFSSFCIGVGGLLGAVRQRSWLALGRVAALGAVVVIGFAINYGPTVLYVREHGKTMVAERAQSDSETFGLKITQLVFPMSGHRVDALRRFKQNYDTSAPLVNENMTEYLGIVGVVGFVYLTLTLVGRFARRRVVGDEGDEELSSPLDTLRALNVSVVLLGTVGGFGAVLAYTVFANIRGYNRISVYIAFFSLLALALLAERFMRTVSSARARIAATVALAAMVALGVLDQAPTMNGPYAELKRTFLVEDAFIHAIERSVPAGASIYQLPYATFPENGSVNKLLDYQLFGPYLHSHGLHWSYGTIRYRNGDAWSKKIAALAPEEMVDALATAGFAGIHVSRAGYADAGAHLESSLTELLGPPALVNADKTEAFYTLAGREAQIRASMSADDFARHRDDVLHPIFVGFLNGFYVPLSNETSSWVSCHRHGKFVIQNPSAHTVRIVLSTRVHTDVPANVSFESDLFSETVHTANDFLFAKTLDVPPGEHFVAVATDAEPVDPPGDWRFTLYDPRVTVVH